MGLRFQRANYLVANMDRALVFYRDVLGFEVAFVEEPRPVSYSHEVFGIGQQTMVGFAALSAPGQPRVLALTEVPNLVAQATPRRAAIVLESDDIDAVLARAKAHGFKVFHEEVLHTHDGRVGREVGLLDADDNLTVLYCILERPQR